MNRGSEVLHISMTRMNSQDTPPLQFHIDAFIFQAQNVCLRAPVSESLSRLHRDQLQKFAQYLISELPQQVGRQSGLGWGYQIMMHSRPIITQFCPKHNRCPIAHLWGWAMGCLLWVRSLTYGQSLSLPCTQYHLIWDLITRLGCINGFVLKGT